MTDLPPLPKPMVFPPHPMFGTEGSYTADQMREYAKAAVESERARLHPFKLAVDDGLKPDPIRGWIVT